MSREIKRYMDRIMHYTSGLVSLVTTILKIYHLIIKSPYLYNHNCADKWFHIVDPYNQYEQHQQYQHNTLPGKNFLGGVGEGWGVYASGS